MTFWRRACLSNMYEGSRGTEAWRPCRGLWREGERASIQYGGRASTVWRGKVPGHGGSSNALRPVALAGHGQRTDNRFETP
jgi:hypothetical protein